MTERNIDKRSNESSVSLIISTHDDFENLKKVLDEIYNMEYQFHEVIVFDDGSTDNTSDKTMYYFGENYNFTLVTYVNKKGFAHTRNEGIIRASGDHLMFLDSNFSIDEKSLSRLLDESQHYNIVYPKTKNLKFSDIKLKEAHESFIKFSHCFIVKKSNLYCFNGVFYDTKLTDMYCDFDFFSRAHIFGLSSYLIKDAESQCLNDMIIEVNLNKLSQSHIMFNALYDDIFATLESNRLLMEALNYDKDISYESLIEKPYDREYVKIRKVEIMDNNNSFYYKYRNSYPRKLSNSHFVLIEVTNACINKCTHCTRGVSILKKSQYMSLEEIEAALISLKGWKRAVALTGGEPTIHPDFLEICELFKKYFPREQRTLFTSGGKIYQEHKKMIHETFGIINYNDHKESSFHQPVFVASSEVMKDKKMLDVLIQRCWTGQVYSFIITKRGGFFCEVAATLDLLHNGNGGFKLEKGWWKKYPDQYKSQVDKYCYKCGSCLPLPSSPDNLKKEIISSKQYDKIKENITDRYSDFEIYTKTHDAFSIFAEIGSKKENYTVLNNDSYWYKENFLDTRARVHLPGKDGLYENQ